MPVYSHFHVDTRRPVPPPPPGSCDSQIHVFGDRRTFPVREGAAYEAPDATIEAALRMHRALGIERGIVVQSTVYGTDHAAVLAALAAAGPGYRGCGVIDDDIDDAELARLDGGGIRGARFNFFAQLGLVPAPGSLRRHAARVAEHGWYVKLQVRGFDLSELVRELRDVDVQVVLDHLGPLWFNPGSSSATVETICRLLDRGNWWLMLSNGDRESREGPPWRDAVDVARTYIQHAPDRMLWATDWPHPLHTGTVPDDADLLELLYRYAPESRVRRQILVENPARLFGFPRLPA